MKYKTDNQFEMQEENFNKFTIEHQIHKDFFNIFVYNKKFLSNSFVGCIGGGIEDTFYRVDSIVIMDKYQGEGYSKFLYKTALDMAKENGCEGLMVGLNLQAPEKTFETYKNFERYETFHDKSYLFPLHKSPLADNFMEPAIILTEWKPKNSSDDSRDGIVKDKYLIFQH